MILHPPAHAEYLLGKKMGSIKPPILFDTCLMWNMWDKDQEENMIEADGGKACKLPVKTNQTLILSYLNFLGNGEDQRILNKILPISILLCMKYE